MWTRRLANAERSGWIRRQPSADARSSVVPRTPAGLDLVEPVVDAVFRSEQGLLEQLTASEPGDLKATLRRLLADIRARSSPDHLDP